MTLLSEKISKLFDEMTILSKKIQLFDEMTLLSEKISKKFQSYLTR